MLCYGALFLPLHFDNKIQTIRGHVVNIYDNATFLQHKSDRLIYSFITDYFKAYI